MADESAPERLAPRRLMELVAVLHARGYEGLRLAPTLAPSGCHWRAAMFAARRPGLRTRSRSSGAGWRLLFDWADAGGMTLDELADRFVREFPEIAEAARHSDTAYATWYAEMLALTAPNGVIYLAADFDLPPSGVGVGGCAPGVVVRAPPRSS